MLPLLSLAWVPGCTGVSFCPMDHGRPARVPFLERGRRVPSSPASAGNRPRTPGTEGAALGVADTRRAIVPTQSPPRSSR